MVDIRRGERYAAPRVRDTMVARQVDVYGCESRLRG